MKPRPLIYVAGPLSIGSVAMNIRAALEAGERLWEMGFVPFVPHLTHFWNFAFPHADTRHAYAFWRKMDFSMLTHCNCMIRLPGASVGADMETAFCEQENIPVFYSYDTAAEWLTAQG